MDKGQQRTREPLDPTYASEIEKLFPRIAQQIVLMWGADDFPLYLDKLMIDERGTRQGFPREVIDEMLFLHSVHDARTGRQSWLMSADDDRLIK